MDENVQLKEREGSQFPMFLGEAHFDGSSSVDSSPRDDANISGLSELGCLQRGKVDVEQDGEGGHASLDLSNSTVTD